jgi:hypothetical protein
MPFYRNGTSDMFVYGARELQKYWWVDNIKMDLREIGWDGMDWIDLA